MYIKIGTTAKPANIKVAGGFVVETPILKIINYSVQQNAYAGTPETAFTTAPTNTYPPIPQLSVSVVYFKSYEDYLNNESMLQLLLPTPSPTEVQTIDIASSYYGIELTGPITDQLIYDGVKAKLEINFKNVSVVSE